MSSSQKKLTLSKPEDWNTWLSFIKTKAVNHQVWDLINPDLPFKPEALERPFEPTFDAGENPEDFDARAYDHYKARHQLYRSALVRLKEQNEAFTNIISFIHETITAQNAVLMQHVEPHSYEILKKLKEQLAPIDRAQSLKLQIRYRRLAKGPGNHNLEAWTNEWAQMYVEATACNLAEVQGDMPVTGFLLAISSKDASYAARPNWAS